MKSLIEVRIDKINHPRDVVQAYCTLTVWTEEGPFSVHDVKLVRLEDDMLMVQMPARDVQSPCLSCQRNCAVRFVFCPWCGEKMPVDRAPLTRSGRPSKTLDIIHPIDQRLRDTITQAVVNAYQDTLSWRRGQKLN